MCICLEKIRPRALVLRFSCHELGGANPFIQAIGSWLRGYRCNGIVFRARSDSWASERDGILDDFGGWNFVDFRGATPGHGKITLVTSCLSTSISANSFRSSRRNAEFRRIEVHGLLRQNIGRFSTMAHHAQHSTKIPQLPISRMDSSQYSIFQAKRYRKSARTFSRSLKRSAIPSTRRLVAWQVRTGLHRKGTLPPE